MLAQSASTHRSPARAEARRGELHGVDWGREPAEDTFEINAKFHTETNQRELVSRELLLANDLDYGLMLDRHGPLGGTLYLLVQGEGNSRCRHVEDRLLSLVDWRRDLENLRGSTK